MPFLFCCKRGFSRWVGGPRRQHSKEERGCTDTYPSVIYTRVGSCRFYPTMAALRARQRGQLAPWSCGRSDALRSHGRQRRGGRLEAGLGSLGARRMQMAAGLSGRCWSPLVCRHTARSGRAREQQDHRRIGCLR